MVNAPNPLLVRAEWAMHALKRWRWVALAVAWALALICAVAIFVVPQRFEASSRVYVDTQTVLKPMMKELTYQPDIEQQVRMLARTLISRPNIERLVDSPQVEAKFRSGDERERTIARLMEQVKIQAAERGNLFTISYRDRSPETALKIVQATVSMFVDSGESGKKQGSLEAVHFVDVQIKTNEAKLIEAENRLKDFKVRNFGVSGVSNQDYFARMSTLSDEVSKLRNDLTAAEHARDAYRKELSSEDPQLPHESLPGAAIPAAVPEIDNRIEAQRRQLDELLRRYTDAHPDVVQARRLVSQLEEQKRQELAGRGSKREGTAATSPVYQRIRVSLAESEAQVASLRSQLAAQSARLAQIRAMASKLPQVEAEFAQLNRDYEVLRKNYDQLVARRESATLGVKLDESKQLADFRVVEPPRVASAPVFPARMHLALFAVILSFVGGVAAALGLDLVRPTFSDAEALEHATGRPVLGNISLSKSDASRRRDRVAIHRFAGACALLVCFQVAWLVWIVTAPTVS